jgi:OmpA-OmpF porin, OOP family
MNIMDFVKPYLTDALMQKASAWLGESQSGVGKAVSAILPTIISMVLSKSSNRGFVDSLSGMLGDSRLNHSAVLDNVGGLFSNDHASSPLGQLGSSFLGGVFGDKLNSVTGAISQHAGVGSGAVSKLLGAFAPMVLALLSKQSAASGGLSALLGLLGGQKGALLSMVPGAISSALGLGGGAATAASSFAENSREAERDSGGGWLWVLPLVAALGFAGWYFTRSHDAPAPAAPAVTTTPPAAVTAPVEPPAPVVDPAPATIPAIDLGAFGERMLPGEVKLNIPANGIESKLIAFIEDASQMVDKETWFDFDRIYFESSSATLTPQSSEQVNNIGMILKAFPNVQLKIGGYTDNTGAADANLTLSQARAESVMAAVVGSGVDASRLKAEGYGDQFPVGDNATEEGRAKNRRVSVRVTAK